MSVANDEALRRELPVVEIFDSVQGEGYYIGQLSTFVRLAGCNMEPPCIWCDTAYAQGGESGSPMTVAQIIEQCRGTHVVITGGEPLRHARTVELCDQLYRRHKLVTLETNGTVYRPGIRWTCNLISVSPKLPSSGHRPDLEVVGQYVRVANHFGSVQIKFVIQDREDLEVALATIKELTPLSGGNEIFWMFQPVALPGMSEGDLLDATSNLIGDIRNTGLWDRAHVRILPQLHRLLWGTQTGV